MVLLYLQALRKTKRTRYEKHKAGREKSRPPLTLHTHHTSSSTVGCLDWGDTAPPSKKEPPL